jgi:isoleucyl-tRNA synthetase
VKQIESIGDAVALDTVLTDELRQEGFVRDTVRAIQAYRKEQGLRPGEKATYRFTGTEEERRVVERYRAAIEKATTTTVEFA